MDRPHQVVEERVFEPDHKLRHLPFFDFIASREETDPEWRTATAGLVVLRLVDAWADEGPAALGGDSWAIASVRAAIDDIGHGTPIRSLLTRVVDAVTQQDAAMRHVMTPLIAYGQALEYEAHWALAADVYHSILGHLDPVTESDSSIAAHISLARCFHNLGQYTPALDTLRAAEEIASKTGDMVGVLRARLDQAKIDLVRGDYARANAIYEDAARQAAGQGLDDVRSRALHGQSNVAYNRGHFELAIQVAYQALHCSQSPKERDRILGDIAVAFLELGVYTAARDAFMVLSATAQEQYVRWAATLNLLEISSQTGAETLFELYRKQLSNQALPPRMSTSFHLNTGLAYRRFGNLEKSRRHLERAFAMAGEHGFTKYVLQAEDALKHLERTPPPARVPTTLSLDTEEVAAAIHQMRQVAGAT